jgi:hypothetical protein
MDEDDFEANEADRMAELLEILTKRIEQLELMLSKERLSSIPTRKLVTIGDDIFASETSHKRAKKKKQSPEVKCLKVSNRDLRCGRRSES